MQTLLQSISWYRLSVSLRNTRFMHSLVKEHPISIMNGIVEYVNYHYGLTKEKGGQKVFFHLLKKSPEFKITEGAIIPLEIFLCGFTFTEADTWTRCFIDYLSATPNNTNYELVERPTLAERNYQSVSQELDGFNPGTEICLEFLSPLSFELQPGKDRTALSKEEFFNALSKRILKLFGVQLPEINSDEMPHILSHIWYYKEIKHFSKSSDEKQYVKGCLGHLYLRGNLPAVLPLIILCSELHAGIKIENSQGYFTISSKPVSWFDKQLSNKNKIKEAIKKVTDKYDYLGEELSALQLDEQDGENQLCDKIYQFIHDGNYQPSPTNAFAILKKSGEERIVEQMNIHDLIIQHFLLGITSEAFEKIMESESVGFRKGISREQAAKLIGKAIGEGYEYIMETDIEDFFSSVDLEILRETLQKYIPLSDLNFRNLLFKTILTPYSLKGITYERKQGLAQGSPLSPMLANIFLDAFDEKIKASDVKLIRYADDFVILSRTKEESENILTGAESFLLGIGLKLKKEKTHLKHISEGFQFLGMQFLNKEMILQTEEEVKLLRKPLYMTQAFSSLGLNADNIEIRKNREITDSIPLRRISALIIMEPCVISSWLMKRCIDLGIPVTMTLNTGYFITSIKPDSKKYHDIHFQHGLRHARLSETEITAIAKSVAAAKIANFIPLFENRYERGTNKIIKELEAAVKHIHDLDSIDQVRGMEGYATKNIFRHLNTIIDEQAFKIVRRDRKEPDCINSLLNFGFYLLFTLMNSTVRALGLNPYLGFLHAETDNYESLVSDLMEPFRADMVRIILKLINRKQITEQDFKMTPKGVFLTAEARKKFILEYEKELNKTGGHSSLSLKEKIYAQATIVKRWAEGTASLTFMNYKG